MSYQLTNEEIVKLVVKLNKNASSGKVAHIRKDLSIEETIKKALCRIVVQYFNENKKEIGLNDLAKILNSSVNITRNILIYKFEKLSIQVLVVILERLSVVDKNSKKSFLRLNKKISDLLK